MKKWGSRIGLSFIVVVFNWAGGRDVACFFGSNHLYMPKYNISHYA